MFMRWIRDEHKIVKMSFERFAYFGGHVVTVRWHTKVINGRLEWKLEEFKNYERLESSLNLLRDDMWNLLEEEYN